MLRAHLRRSLAVAAAETQLYTLATLIPPPPPTPVINNASGPIVATAGATVTLDSSGTTCPGGGCVTSWALDCPEGRGSFANRTGSAINITTGDSVGVDINTTGASQPFNCECRTAGMRACARPAPGAARGSALALVGLPGQTPKVVWGGRCPRPGAGTLRPRIAPNTRNPRLPQARSP